MWNGGGMLSGGHSQAPGMTLLLSPELDASPSNLPPKLPLTIALVWSRVCTDSMCEEALQRARGFAQHQALVEARDSRGGGGAAHRQPLLAWEAGEWWPVQTLLFANKQLKLEGELVFVCSGWC